MKNAKYIFSAVLVTILIYPSLTFASWWNPLSWSWFHKTVQTESAQISTSTINLTDVKATSSSEVNNKPKETVVKTPSVKVSTKLTNAQIIQKVKPAVVYIETTEGSGSGMIISSDGYILTNAHVVKGFSIASITLSTGDKYSGNVVGRDEGADVAIVKIIPSGYLPKVELGNSNNLEQGDNVFAIGFPFGLKGEASFTTGVISRLFSDYIGHSAEIHPGNSGGPLVNEYGQVIGINTASYTDQVIEGIQLGETIKLALPINIAKNLIPSLEAGSNIIVESQKEKDDKAKLAKEKSCTEGSVAYYNQYVQKVNDLFSTNDLDYQALVSKIDQYEATLKQTRDSSVADITSRYDNLISQQQTANANYVGVITQAGITSGQSRYAPEMSAGSVQSANTYGNQQIAYLESQKSGAIAKIDYNYQIALQKYESYRTKAENDLENNRKTALGSANSEKEKYYQNCLSK